MLSAIELDTQTYINAGHAIALVGYGAYMTWVHRKIGGRVDCVDAKVDSNYGDLKADIDAVQTALNNLASKVAARTGSKPLPSTTEQWAAARQADTTKRYSPDVIPVRGAGDVAP